VTFVQVPVPAEHVLEVMRWVLFRTVEEEGARERDAASVRALLAGSDLRTRRLLYLVATRAIEGQPPRFRDVADELDEDRVAAQALVDELNQTALEDGRELLETWKELTVGLEGRQGTMVFIGMRPDLAQIVRSAGPPPSG